MTQWLGLVNKALVIHISCFFFHLYSRWKWPDTKDPYSNHQKKTITIVGHMSRAYGLEKQILSGKICGTKSRGRQGTKYTDSLNNFITRKKNLPTLSLSWQLETERVGRPWTPISENWPGTWEWWYSHLLCTSSFWNVLQKKLQLHFNKSFLKQWL